MKEELFMVKKAVNHHNSTKISKNVRSQNQFKKYETETRLLRDQDQDRQQKAETETLKIGLETKTGLETFITERFCDQCRNKR